MKWVHYDTSYIELLNFQTRGFHRRKISNCTPSTCYFNTSCSYL